MKKLIFKNEQRRNEVKNLANQSQTEANEVLNLYRATNLPEMQNPANDLRELINNTKNFILDRSVPPELIKNLDRNKYFEMLNIEGLPELLDRIKSLRDVYGGIDLLLYDSKTKAFELDLKLIEAAAAVSDIYANTKAENEIYEAVDAIKTSYEVLQRYGFDWREVITLYTQVDNYSNNESTKKLVLQTGKLRKLFEQSNR